jgi:hypothetical protein
MNPTIVNFIKPPLLSTFRLRTLAKIRANTTRTTGPSFCKKDGRKHKTENQKHSEKLINPTNNSIIIIIIGSSVECVKKQNILTRKIIHIIRGKRTHSVLFQLAVLLVREKCAPRLIEPACLCSSVAPRAKSNFFVCSTPPVHRPVPNVEFLKFQNVIIVCVLSRQKSENEKVKKNKLCN